MTQTIAFTQEFGYPSERRPSLTIEVIPPTGGRYEVPVILDTGAAISMFDHARAARMGIPNVTQGYTKRFNAFTASNEQSVGYLHDVEIVFLGRTVTIPIAFCPDWPQGTNNLLGMEGFFEQGIFGFDHVRRMVYLRI